MAKTTGTSGPRTTINAYKIILILIGVVLNFATPSFSSVQLEGECTNAEFKCSDGACVKQDVLCNLFDDCRDGSDERDCANAICASNQFKCTSGQCIKSDYFCDGYPECGDRSDESNCTECVKNESRLQVIKCETDNKCISIHSLCNLHIDCPDGSDEDEVACKSPHRKCDKDMFRCLSGECVWDGGRCNGRPDCSDNSDETNCTVCDPLTFKCEANQVCILKDKLCDTEPDCPDGSDENVQFCKNRKCRTYRSDFLCGSGECIDNYRNSSICDGVKNCKDGSDEAYCANCSSEAYKCSKGGGCLHKTDLCNGIWDCDDGSDENNVVCPGGATPGTWTTFWRKSLNPEIKNLTKVFSDVDVVVYMEEAEHRSSIVWPLSYLSQAWEYSWQTYGPLGRNSLLYVILTKNKNQYNHQYHYSCVQPDSGHRNLIDSGLSERNAWSIEKTENFELLFSNMAAIVQIGAEGNVNYAEVEICGFGMMGIVFYDVYKHLKGESPDVIEYLDKIKGGQNAAKVGEFNCFQDWLLPIYDKYGGSAVVSKYFSIMKLQWPKKKGIYARAKDGHKQLNLGEFVHFWSGAAGADLTDFANATFGWNEINKVQLEQAKIQFPGLFYGDSNSGYLSIGAISGIIAGLVLLLALVVILGLKVGLPILRKKYFTVSRAS